jgi:hypothetical protein
MGGIGSGRRSATLNPPPRPALSLDDWVTILCGQCDERFQVRRTLYETWKRSSQNWHCPHGHVRHYPQGKSETQKLQEQLEEERRKRQRIEQDAAYQRDMRREAEEQAKHERNRANGYKGHATRITKRAKAGVCPCCNRTFQQLARHMQTKHPQFTPMPPELEVIEGGKAVA